jgi:drug/metabolite transporter (DMT)-like permease
MDAWIFLSLGAALAQTVRFMLQKQLRSTRLSTGGATFARFVYSAPLVALAAFAYSRGTGQAIPEVSARFWLFALSGGAAQIVATMCVVALFAHRNFAVGTTFKNTEVLMSVGVGFVLLGEFVTGPGLAAIVLGLFGVIFLSDPPTAQGRGLSRLFNRAAGLGLASGVLFSISAVGYRGAALALDSGDAFQRAVVTLACVTGSQLIAQGIWLLWREPGEVARVLRAWRVAGLVGLASMAGSLCWFTAFALQNVAYVKAVGQVELAFSLVIGWLVFGEKISRREWQGMIFLAGSVLLLILAA